MSTTISYKGGTLGTVENESKKLNTQGTWLEDDITITDVTQSGGSVVVVDTPDSHGGTIREITTENEVYLQGAKQITLSASPSTVSPDTGYNGFSSVVVPQGFAAQDFFAKTISGEITLTRTSTAYNFRKYCFDGCPITKVIIESTATSNCTVGFDENAFQNCIDLTEIIYNNKYIRVWHGASSLKGCTSLQYITQAYDFYATACNGCSNLLGVDFFNYQTSSSTGLLRTQTFLNCSKLKTLILRKTDMPYTLSNVNNFQGTPFASGGTGGTIYIPESLYNHLGDGSSSDYKAATNWATIDGYGTITWAKIEGSTYETHYVNGTTIPT